MRQIFLPKIDNFVGAPTRTRTANLLITNQLLYQLSYEGLMDLVGYNYFFCKLNKLFVFTY